MKLFLTYGLLMFSILSMWIDSYLQKRVKISHFLLIIAALSGFYYNFINITGLVLVLVIVVVLDNKKNVDNNYFFWIFVFVISALLFLHKFPGFNNYKVISERVISKQGLPYTMYLNFDKALVGLFILSYYNGLSLKIREWKQILKTILTTGLLTIIVVITFSLISGYVKFDPKLISFLPLLMAVNLLFVCLPEEAFFRRFLQGNINKFLVVRGSEKWAILIAALVFGLGHFAGGIKYIILATIAGIGYGYSYSRTGKIESSILIHFLLNLIHLCFLTYPALS